MPDVPIRRATVTVRLPDGLHLRPLTQLARLAQSFSSTTTLRKGAQIVDAKRPLDLMTLAAACGEQLELEARGDDADDAVEAIVSLFESDFAVAD
ncbi:MAG: HPr family phosphocarrier protein [Planctomycetaceae bacterium]